MSSDRDGTLGGWATPGDDQPDAESAIETTGEFTIEAGALMLALNVRTINRYD